MHDPIGDAVKRVRSGKLIAYPTETVWGIGADATSAAAVDRLRSWKGRADDAPISILVASFADLASLGCRVEEAARKLADVFWPGPLMLVVPCSHSFAKGIGRADGAVGVRCSAHPLAGALARRCQAEGTGPITSTSFNRSGDPAASTRTEASSLVAGDLDAPQIIDVETAEAGGGQESTIVDLSDGPPRVLRWGAVPAEEIEPVLERIAAR
jgi:L-threonylcarbamoyladenylate synthase